MRIHNHRSIASCPNFFGQVAARDSLTPTIGLQEAGELWAIIWKYLEFERPWPKKLVIRHSRLIASSTNRCPVCGEEVDGLDDTHCQVHWEAICDATWWAAIEGLPQNS